MTETATILRQEVRRNGVINFARFMELALYCPDFGYYEQPQSRIGRSGDFYTSVSVGSLFGELLALKFAEWLDVLDRPRIQLVEAGAHDGRLACDILSWLELKRPQTFSRLDYWLVEPSPRRQSWQREKLERFGNTTRWVTKLADFPQPGISGIIFSNELLDAFPVHRLGYDAKLKSWFEWGVACEGEQFVCRRIDEATRDWRTELRQGGFSLSPELESVLPDGFILELSPAATNWWRQAAGVLRMGKLLTIDYGFTAEELLRPERCNGTLRAFSHHHVSSSILTDPGGQDLTAHVNFTGIQNAGHEMGLQTETFVSQSQFLTRIAQSAWRSSQLSDHPNSAILRQFQTLVHPSHLGQSFRVLIQARESPRFI